MTISARIVAVSEHSDFIYLELKPRQVLLITHHTRVPLVGQRITGHHAGHCIVEGEGGERIVYARQGSFLREQVG